MATNPEQLVIYSDLNSRLGVQSNYGLVLNEDAISGSITNIIQTKKGTRVYQRGFGCELMRYLFEPLTQRTAVLIRDEIGGAIARYENRVRLTLVDVVPDISIDGYYVELQGYIPRLENKAYNYNFNLLRPQG